MDHRKHKSTESLEDYLETILFLQKKNGQVRSIDIATELGFSKPSVSVAMKNLREQEYITMADNGYITLTPSGRQRAEDVLERHTLISGWLISLGVNPSTAREDACMIEHDLSEESFDAIKRFLEK
ncbi:MAG: metal-dependent transcriptional regulator [Lachnospiraceae bacterium]|nr:metal-dependent transcriptional regulator [Lachnospiraceae bacterium]